MKTSLACLCVVASFSFAACSTPRLLATPTSINECEEAWAPSCSELIYKTYVASQKCAIEDGEDVLRENAKAVALWREDYSSEVTRDDGVFIVSYVLPDHYFKRQYALSIDLFFEHGVCARMEFGLIVR